MKTKRLACLFMAVMGLFFSQRADGQIFETRSGVDTLKWSERISVHANAADWALLVPNVGVEFDVLNTNWNRWAVGLDVRARWKTPSTFKRHTFYSIAEARVYFREYWRTRQVDRDFLPAHDNIFGRLFSCRRTKVKHPHTTYYRGLYASFADVSFSVGGSRGRQGKIVTGGVTYGIVRPLYVFGSGNSLDLDLGIDVGIAATHLEHFRVSNDECYVREKPAQLKIIPIPLPTQLRFGFVYRMGSYPITKKYRWRYDVDVKYQEAMRDRILADAKARRDKQNADSLSNRILTDFQQNYDSIVVEAAKNRILHEAAAKKAEAEKAKKAEEAKKAKEAEETEMVKKAEEEKAKEADESKKAEEQKSDTTEVDRPKEIGQPTEAAQPTDAGTSQEGEDNSTEEKSQDDDKPSAEEDESAKSDRPVEEQPSGQEDQQPADGGK